MRRACGERYDATTPPNSTPLSADFIFILEEAENHGNCIQDNVYIDSLVAAPELLFNASECP